MANLSERTALSNKDLTKILIKHYKIKTGYYELSVGFVFTAGGVHGPESSILPGMTIGINGITLAESTAENLNAVNAKDIK